MGKYSYIERYGEREEFEQIEKVEKDDQAKRNERGKEDLKNLEGRIPDLHEQLGAAKQALRDLQFGPSISKNEMKEKFGSLSKVQRRLKEIEVELQNLDGKLQIAGMNLDDEKKKMGILRKLLNRPNKAVKELDQQVAELHQRIAQLAAEGKELWAAEEVLSGRTSKALQLKIAREKIKDIEKKIASTEERLRQAQSDANYTKPERKLVHDPRPWD